MGTADRSTLKKFFESGRMPSERQFADLIDSMLNMVDEGFDKTEQRQQHRRDVTTDLLTLFSTSSARRTSQIQLRQSISCKSDALSS